MGNRLMRLRAALAASMLIVGTAAAGVPEEGLVLRAAGMFWAEASGDGQCAIPGVDDGIPVSSDAINLSAEVLYPLDSCGGWMQLQNVMTAQGVTILRVEIRHKIAGAGRFRQFVPTRNGFPTACRNLQRSTVFAGAHLWPLGTDPGFGNTGSGAPHLAFVNLFPMLDAQTLGCLREQYSGLPASVYTSFPLVMRMKAVGITDTGDIIRSNVIRFTLNLLHLCGNGRIDITEDCDPNGTDTCNVGPCDTENGGCRDNGAIFCQTDADCAGRCLQEGDPNECSCLYGGN